jgi:hypothetical protein
MRRLLRDKQPSAFADVRCQRVRVELGECTLFALPCQMFRSGDSSNLAAHFVSFEAYNCSECGSDVTHTVPAALSSNSGVGCGKGDRPAAHALLARNGEPSSTRGEEPWTARGQPPGAHHLLTSGA